MHVLALLDGVVCVVAFSALTIRTLGINGIYLSMTFNGIVTTLVIIGYAWRKRRHFPHSMDDLMVIPEDFGVSEDERMDLSIVSIGEVVTVSRKVQDFCLERGIDQRRSYLAGLSMEEMAGNIVEHGFEKDNRKHYVDIRVVHKNDDVILRIKDDCIPFDPGERSRMASDDDITRNIGIKMIFRMARDVQYQNILGLNVLTIRI